MHFDDGASDVDRVIDDNLLLETIPGAESLLRRETGASGALVRGGVLLQHRQAIRRLLPLRLLTVPSVMLSEGGPEAEVLASIARSLERGALAALRDRPIRFRVGPMPLRWELRDQLVDHLGWVNDPSRWAVNLERRGDLLVAQLGPLHRTQRLGALVRLPASTNPVTAAALVALARLRPGFRVLDPFCGAGTIVVEALLAEPSAAAIAWDNSPAAVAATRANLARFSADTYDVSLADATTADRETSVDRVITNLPFGKRVGTHRSNVDLYPLFVARLAHLLAEDGRAVLLTEEKRLLTHAVRGSGLRITSEQTFETGGLHPSAYVVERT